MKMIKYAVSIKYSKDKSFDTQPTHLDVLIKILEKTEPSIISRGHDSFIFRPNPFAITEWVQTISTVFPNMEECQTAVESFKTELKKELKELKALKTTIEGASS